MPILDLRQYTKARSLVRQSAGAVWSAILIKTGKAGFYNIGTAQEDKPC